MRSKGLNIIPVGFPHIEMMCGSFGKEWNELEWNVWNIRLSATMPSAGHPQTKRMSYDPDLLR